MCPSSPPCAWEEALAPLNLAKTTTWMNRNNGTRKHGMMIQGKVVIKELLGGP
jgi:hypothetical protein